MEWISPLFEERMEWISLLFEERWMVCFLMFFLDLGTKLGMNAYFGKPKSLLHSNIDIIPGVLYLTLTYNTGAAYGSGANMGPWMRILFACVSFIAGVVIIYFLAKYFKKLSGWKRYAIYLILAGDWGNFIDRAFYWNKDGIYGVIDWIGVGNSSWPSFFQYVCNWADVCLTIGAVILVLAFIIEWVVEEKKQKQAVDEAMNKSKVGEAGSSYAVAEQMMEEEEQKAIKEEKSEAEVETKTEERTLSDVLRSDESISKEDKTEDKTNVEEEKKEDDGEFSSLSDFLKGEK